MTSTETTVGTKRRVRSATGIDSQRPLRPVPLDPAAFDDFNRGVIRARNAYLAEHSAAFRDEQRRIAVSRRYYARKERS